MARRATKDAEAAVADSVNQTGEVVQAEKKPKAVKDAVYSVAELAANARKIFNTRQECVSAALRAAGKTECTVTEAKIIVEKFLKKEVK